MKNLLIRIMILFFVMVSFSSCKLIKGIFEAGMVYGIFLVVAFIGLIIFLLSKLFGGGKG